MVIQAIMVVQSYGVLQMEQYPTVHSQATPQSIVQQSSGPVLHMEQSATVHS